MDVRLLREMLLVERKHEEGFKRVECPGPSEVNAEWSCEGADVDGEESKLAEGDMKRVKPGLSSEAHGFTSLASLSITHAENGDAGNDSQILGIPTCTFALLVSSGSVSPNDGADMSVKEDRMENC